MCKLYGKEKAKEILSNALYEHSIYSYGSIFYHNTNVLLVGPTGCGKTFVINNFLKTANLPYSICDLKKVNSESILNDIFKTLYLNSNKNLDIAEKGIVVLENIDCFKDYKLLIKLLSGTTVKIKISKFKKININTHNILFIATANFNNKIIKENKCEIYNIPFYDLDSLLDAGMDRDLIDYFFHFVFMDHHTKLQLYRIAEEYINKNKYPNLSFTMDAINEIIIQDICDNLDANGIFITIDNIVNNFSKNDEYTVITKDLVKKILKA